MLRRLTKRLSYANVTATTALFIALGGSSYAAIALPRNSVGPNQIRANAVRSSEVKDRSLSVRDLSLLARNALRGERGPAGPAGPVGGTPGTPGAASLVFTYRTVNGSLNGTADDNDKPTTSATATCDPGQRVTGGGVKIDDADIAEGDVVDSYPAGSTGWTAHVSNDAGVGNFVGFTVFAVCTAGTS